MCFWPLHFLKVSPVFNSYIGQWFLEEPNKSSYCSQESIHSPFSRTGFKGTVPEITTGMEHCLNSRAKLQASMSPWPHKVMQSLSSGMSVLENGLFHCSSNSFVSLFLNKLLFGQKTSDYNRIPQGMHGRYRAKVNSCWLILSWG